MASAGANALIITGVLWTIAAVAQEFLLTAW